MQQLSVDYVPCSSGDTCSATFLSVWKFKLKNLEEQKTKLTPDDCSFFQQRRVNEHYPDSQSIRPTEERQCLYVWEGNMRNPVTVLTTLLSVEFVLYTMSLCSPQWLVQTEGASEGLFAFCRAYEGFSSCTTFPAWLGKHPLTMMPSMV